MAKKRLGTPLAPEGPQLDFFVRMQDFVLDCDDPSLATMATKVLRTRQVLHRALRGPDLPSRVLVADMVDLLFPDADPADDAEEHANRKAQVKRDLLRAWSEAVADARTRSRARDLGKQATAKAAAADERARFQRALQAAYDRGGRPALKRLSMRMQQLDHYISASTLSDWLTGKSLPRDAAVLGVLLHALSRSASGPDSTMRSSLERHWENAVDAQAAARRRRVRDGQD